MKDRPSLTQTGLAMDDRRHAGSRNQVSDQDRSTAFCSNPVAHGYREARLTLVQSLAADRHSSPEKPDRKDGACVGAVKIAEPRMIKFVASGSTAENLSHV